MGGSVQFTVQRKEIAQPVSEPTQLEFRVFSKLLWDTVGRNLLVQTKLALTKALKNKNNTHIRLQGKVLTRTGLLLPEDMAASIEERSILDAKAFVLQQEKINRQMEYYEELREYGNEDGPL